MKSLNGAAAVPNGGAVSPKLAQEISALAARKPQLRVADVAHATVLIKFSAEYWAVYQNARSESNAAVDKLHEETGIREKSNQSRLRLIGEHASTLLVHIESLPCSAEALFDLASAEGKKTGSIAKWLRGAKPLVTPKTTVMELRKLRGQTHKRSQAKTQDSTVAAAFEAVLRCDDFGELAAACAHVVADLVSFGQVKVGIPEDKLRDEALRLAGPDPTGLKAARVSR